MAIDKNSDREVLLSVQNLTVDFKLGRKTFSAVDDVSFDIFKGETFSLVGESGSGKTTVSRAIMRIHQASKGKSVLLMSASVHRS
jgi:ABC-type oligopeptide transport system ATPase subunit